MNSGMLLDDWNKIEDSAVNDLNELVIDIDGFEGPLDLLLTLSRTQKVDLLKISILQLVDQYMSFIDRAKSLRLELAADYLVMAAWLAFLKSRLLLPTDPDDGPSGDELAAYLAFQLERLSGMRNSAKKTASADDDRRQNTISRENSIRKAPDI